MQHCQRSAWKAITLDIQGHKAMRTAMTILVDPQAVLEGQQWARYAGASCQLLLTLAKGLACARSETSYG